MLASALGSPARFSLVSLLCLILAGCSSTQSPIACGGISGGAGGGMCTNPNLRLYATTTSNQILAFSVSASGSLTALTPATGPANSNSVASEGLFLMFSDQSTNTVASEQINGTGP